MASCPRPLKIGIVCYPLIGGSGILATELGHELAARGHDVHFISYARPIRLHSDGPGLHYHAVQVSEYSLFKYPDYTLPLAVKMAEVAREVNLDLWHVHYAVPHATAAWLARQLLNASRPKILTTLHGTDTTLLGKDPNYQAAIEHALAQSDALTTVSHSLKEETMRTFSIQRPLRVIHNFFEPEPVTRTRAEVRSDLGLSADTVMILHMSNLRAVKRIDLLLETLAKSGTKQSAHLVILSGSDGLEYEPLIEKLGLSDQVSIHENAGNVEDYLQAADVGLYTSEAESFGLSILESLTFGVPVAAFEVGGIHEVVDHGASGFLAPFGDTETLASYLRQLCRDASLRKKLGAHGQERARSRFSAAAIIPQYEACYHELIASHAPFGT